MPAESDAITRRRLFGNAAATVGTAFLILKPRTVWGYQANSAVRLGLLGCGGRGTAVATSFSKNTSARVVALGDIFADQLERGSDYFGTLAGSLGYSGPERNMLFRGPHAYQEMAASRNIDAIQISTPPFFHVEHLDAAVQGGKHVYCEKPMGIDVPQTMRALEIAKRADGKVSVDVGFQIRSAPPFGELVRRIHSGALGKIVSISAHYYAPAIQYPERPPQISPEELRLRNWNWAVNLSGDIIVEQDIHVVDICNWILQSRPAAVYATGGRNVVQHFGDNFDNYQVTYTYPGGVHVTLATKQYGTDTFFDVSEQVFGSDGYSESPYSGPLRIVSNSPWEWQPSKVAQPEGGQFAANGVFSDNLAQADSEKDKGYIESIVTGKFHNQIATGVETALSTIMARMSARGGGRVITWDEMMASKERFELGFDLNQLA